MTSPTNTNEQVEAVDHRAEAERCLQWVVGDQGPNALLDSTEGSIANALRLAQAHATLAVAEELRGLNEKFEAAALTYRDGMVRL
jgi:hypothetical protein